MWGGAGQFVAAVIAVALLVPTGAFLHAEPALAPYVSPGRAFASLPEQGETKAPLPRARPRTLHTYVRQISHNFVPPAKRTALIVGIDHAAGTPSLPGSVTDANNLRQALLAYGFRDENVRVLRNAEATRPTILTELRSLARRTPTSGLAVFAIATHTRRSGRTNQLATAEGARISAAELASHLSEVQAPAWIALPTCFAGGYALPGIVGFNRIATFASSADQPSYQAGEAGSFLFIHMVRRAMVEGLSSHSVESAFNFARQQLERDHPEFVPSISDGYPGDLILGPEIASASRGSPRRTTTSASDSGQDHRYTSYETYGADPSPTPQPRRRRSRSEPYVCGSVRYNCPR